MAFTEVLGLTQWASLLEVKRFELTLGEEHCDGSLKEDNPAIEVQHVELLDHFLAAFVVQFGAAPVEATLEHIQKGIEQLQ